MVGQHIGKYRVTEQIGRGGMGTVYRAMDETLHREVAIKVLNTDLNDPTVARRFRAEAVTVARLNHPGIATIYELLQHDGQWLMVMEFLRGETLEAIVAKGGALAVPRATDLMMQALAALAHAHSLGVVHRDLKPANLMLSDNGIVKIMDFGIARVAGGEQFTSAGFMMGTPAYMAPEQVLGQEIDARTDLYATGLVLYHLMTAKLAFPGVSPLEQAQARIQDLPTPLDTVRPELPPWVSQVLNIALARAPEGRYQTALLFREALRRGLANLPVETPTTNVVPPELVATAAPSSMPVLTTPPLGIPPAAKIELPGTTASTLTPAAAATIASGPVPVARNIESSSSAVTAASPNFAGSSAPVPSRALDTEAQPLEARSKSPMAAIVGIAAVLGVAVGVWLWMRPAPPPALAPMEAAPTTIAAVPEPAPLPPPLTPAPTSAAAPTTVAPTTAAPVAVAPVPTTPASGRTAGAATPVAPASPGGTTGAPGAPAAPAAAPGARAGAAGAPVAGRAAAAAAAARGGDAGRGAAADVPVTFKNVRAFIVTGTKVEERDASLVFGNGRVALNDEKGQNRYGAMNYADITAAAHTRAKNPRWFPTLAAPPAQVDMPGGLFRSDRHWVAFQSRAAYLIVRVEDADYRRVIDTANMRLSVKVETLPGR